MPTERIVLPRPPYIPFIVRFWRGMSINNETGCWDWVKSQNGNGYAQLDGIYVHRYSYKIHIGPIPKGLDIHHKCHNRICVNPAHLEAITHKENIRRRLDTGVIRRPDGRWISNKEN